MNEFDELMARFHELESLVKKKKRHDIEAFTGLKKLLIDAFECGQKTFYDRSEGEEKKALACAYSEGVMDGKSLRVLDHCRMAGKAKTARKTASCRDNGACKHSSFLGKEQTSFI